jgi:hypothetical protein
MTTHPYPKILAAASLLLLAGADPARMPAPEHKGKVDLVIALDTSGSMEGLIDSARARLWDAVNLLATAKPRPVLRVGLIQYGNDGIARETGFTRTEMDLTTDLDAVYAKLFALRTNGGYEYVARATKHAADRMSWDRDRETLRLLFVAGNEPADQDPEVTLEKALGLAKEKRIIVNTIYCGNAGAEEARLWQKVAADGKGRYASIDQHRAVVAAISTPHDAELARLSSELNTTYVAYGAQGHVKAENQKAQDANASASGGYAASARAVSKSSGLYRASDWDLVDALKDGTVKLEELKPAELPEPLRAMPDGERAKWVEEKRKERESIQKKIAELSQERDRYISAERAKMAKAGAAGLDEAMNGAIRAQAEAAGFTF